MAESSYGRLRELAAELDRPLASLIALSDDNDPFLADRPGRRLEGAQWFAALWKQLSIPDGVHVRRLHYLLCSTAGIACPDGARYENTHRHWKFLGSASADARYLDLVPAAAFVDRRAAEPMIYVPDDAGHPASTPIYDRSPALELDEQAVLDYTPATLEFPSLPSADLVPPKLAEPFAIELWAEKSTMDDVLAPIAQNRGVTLVTGVGELSVTACLGLVRRVRAHRRRTRILYISDHDPAGEGMPVSVARKIEFFLRRDGDDELDIRLRPLVLTADQVAEFDLPRIPIKETDARRGRFEQRHGGGAVELDALEALHPGALGQIVEEAIAKIREPAHRLRARITRKAIGLQADLVEAQETVLEQHAADIEPLQAAFAESEIEIDAHQQAIDDAIAGAQAAIEAHEAAIETKARHWQELAAPVWAAIAADLEAALPDLDAIEWPTLEEGDEGEEPLYDSRRGYLDQIAAYKQHQGRPAERVEHSLICAACGAEFVSRRATTRCCSKDCRNRLYRGLASDRKAP